MSCIEALRTSMPRLEAVWFSTSSGVSALIIFSTAHNGPVSCALLLYRAQRTCVLCAPSIPGTTDLRPVRSFYTGHNGPASRALLLYRAQRTCVLCPDHPYKAFTA